MQASATVPRAAMASIRSWANVTWIASWIVLLGLILHYIQRDALHYLLRYTPESFKEFWPERIVIRSHIAAAMIMILLGPLQFWTGFRMRHRTLHQWAGRTFLVTGTIAAVCILYMGLHPVLGGVVYGFGLFLNGAYWLAAAGMAYYSIRVGQVQIHKEWMIRTYVLACSGLVFVRLILDWEFLGRRIGTLAQNDLSTWVNWVVPMMITEIVLQFRRLRKVPV